MALAAMRRHRRWLYGFLWLVILAFVILYVPALSDQQQGTQAETVVNVGGLPISAGEYQRAYSRQRAFYAQMYQGRLDESMLERLGLDSQVLETLVSERLVELEAKRLGISVSDEAVARAIASSPEFQDEGKFIGKDEIRRRLELAGLSEGELERSLRQRLERESLEGLIGAGVEASDAEVEREFRRQTEQVRLEYVLADSARLGLATAQAGAGQYDEAIAGYRSLSERRDGAFPPEGVLMQLARTYRSAGKIEEARQTYTRVVEEFPNSLFSAEAQRELELLKST